MEKAKVNGMPLEYEVKGSGEPVLLISTGPIADSFLPLFPEKALAGYRLIRYRQRGLDRSANGPAPVSFARACGRCRCAARPSRRPSRACRRPLDGGCHRPSAGGRSSRHRSDAGPSEPPLASAPSAGAFFEKAGPALAAYGAGDRDGAMSRFLSVVCSLDWETCQKVIDQYVPGGVARAMKSSTSTISSAATCPPSSMAVRARSGRGHLAAGALAWWARTASGCSWIATSCSTPGSRRSRTAGSRAWRICCTCSGRSRWPEAWPGSLPGTQ